MKDRYITYKGQRLTRDKGQKEMMEEKMFLNIDFYTK